MTQAALSLPNQLTSAHIMRARALANETGGNLVRELELMFHSDPDDFIRALAGSLGFEATTANQIAHLIPNFEALSFTEASNRRCVIARNVDDQEIVVFADPFSPDLLSWIRFRFPEATLTLAHLDTLVGWLAQCEEQFRALPTPTGTEQSWSDSVQAGELLSLAQISVDQSPVIRLVNSSLYDALRAGASDIHLETDARGLTVKFRLDGVLSKVGRVDNVQTSEQILSRIKVMAELDIAERRVPQDGRLQVHYAGRTVDVRVSIMPSIHGEDAVLRILDRQSLAAELAGLSLRNLGFESDLAHSIHQLANLPYGMLLVTGPTGSGKTTTLYAALSDTHDPQSKTITIEDPVEYQLSGVLQIPVNEKKGLTFARGLRSILRHDPDRILVGEIRDAETAQIAVQSALTGHMVLTTVHANGVLDVFGRFVQFGIDPYSFVSALNGILAQRLLRKLCPHCAQARAFDEKLLNESTISKTMQEAGNWKQAKGCQHCRGSGYKGRFAIGEVLKLNASLRSLIADRATLSTIAAAAADAGLVPLRAQALAMAAAGLTSLEEANRVTSG